MNLDDIITTGDLKEELGVSYTRAQTILGAVGGGVRKGNVTFYERRKVQQYLAQENVNLLAFLECGPVPANIPESVDN